MDKYNILQKLNDGLVSVDEAFKQIKGAYDQSNNLSYAHERNVRVNKSSADGSLRNPECLILFDTDFIIYEYFKKILPGIQVILVQQGENYEQIISETKAELVDFVYLWSKNTDYSGMNEITEAEISKSLNNLFYPFVDCCQALLKNNKIKKANLSFGFYLKPQRMNPFHQAFQSFFRNLVNENKKFNYKVIQMEPVIGPGQFVEELLSPQFNSYCIMTEHDHYYKEVSMFSPKSDVSVPLKEKGTYLVTGGLGGIGKILSKYLITKYQCQVILLGRSEPNQQAQAFLEEMNLNNQRVEYCQCDITNYNHFQKLYQQLKQKYHKINGIFHAAGVIKDSFLINKSRSDIQEVLNVKISGTMSLINQRILDDLDLLVFFSSVSVLGSLGQSDYVYGNSFINQCADILWYSGYRNVCSINWPLWLNGGMQVSPNLKDDGDADISFRALSDTEGLKALETALGCNQSSVYIFKGSKAEVTTLLNKVNEKKIDKKILNGSEKEFTPQEKQQAEIFFISLFSKVTGIKAKRISLTEPLAQYGIDSIMIMNLSRELEKNFEDVSKTLFFEFQTLAEVVNYFLASDPKKVKMLIGGEGAQSHHAANPQPSQQILRLKNRLADNGGDRAMPLTELTAYTEDIAVIGISGVYPLADNLDQFWDNLKAGRDCITEVPASRWDYKEYDTNDKNDANKSYSKWGGFLNQIDEFDPLFFNISPKEAVLMDPQERMFLQTAWNSIEDAGYSLRQISNRKAGVYVGVMYGHYQLNGASKEMQNRGFFPSSSYASIANRVSYFFNLKGASMAIDTMCSSSLVAIHLACESIRSGENELALAGGVNLMTHPNKYLQLCKGKYLSTDGKCRSFGLGGDGYVPGEGVGAVLLKPLKKAERDRDHIYGVIKGSAVNHGGKTSGYSVPNLAAQSEAITSALKKAGKTPADISYVEAHGTGTELGDPIEIQGLRRAYREFGSMDDGCLIGSVKSNIGHLESAAGISALTKVLLQMKHHNIVPSLHSEQLNPNINFKDTPFEVVQENREWRDDQKPRTAAISSFGAGGTNCHLIVESYHHQPELLQEKPNLFLLSAKNMAALMRYTADFKAALNRNRINRFAPENNTNGQGSGLLQLMEEFTGINRKDLASFETVEELGLDPYDLAALQEAIQKKLKLSVHANDLGHLQLVDGEQFPVCSQPGLSDDLGIALGQIASTHQMRRTHFGKRLAVLAEDSHDLLKKLDMIVNQDLDDEAIFIGEVTDHESIGELYSGLEGKHFLDSLIEKRELTKIARLWVSGVDFKWEKLYEQLPVTTSISNYPFEKEHYWIPVGDNTPVSEQSTPVSGDTSIKEYIEWDIRSLMTNLLDLPAAKIDSQITFNEFGFDSIAMKDFAASISEYYAIDFSVIVLFDYATVQKLSQYLYDYHQQEVRAKHSIKEAVPVNVMVQEMVNSRDSGQERDDDEIAIVGISGIMPQSGNLEEFWLHLEQEQDLISEIPIERWDWRAYQEGPVSTKSKYGGFIPEVDRFDAGFFRISPMEAEMMDPQQRLFLQTVWHVFEDAGLKISDYSDQPVGLFAGVQFSDYQKILADLGVLNPMMGLGNEHCILTNRISYMFNFRGPSEVYNTACSSSLVALHRAVESIKSGESKIAVAGGVSLMLSPYTMISADQMGILSSDGKCKSLDESGDGYVKGEGVGAVLLMPLKEAIRSNRNIYGVIKATVVNHGGKSTSLTAPNTRAEKQLMIEAMRRGKVRPDQVSYIELHGTGTQLGDPIETEAIKQAFEEYAKELKLELGQEFCGIGTVKTNIGHLEPAAGIAGLLKVLLSLKHHKLPGLLHLKNQNPYVRLEQSPFYIVKKTMDWKTIYDVEGKAVPKYVGVNSFGFGGVNAHVLIQEYIEPIKVSEKEKQLVVLSAKTLDSLNQYIRDLSKWLKNTSDDKLAAIAYTLQTGREFMKYRAAFVAESTDKLQSKLIRFLEQDQKDNLIQPDGEYEKDHLVRLACSWEKGEDVDFSQLWIAKTKSIISLPVYPFEKKRYWIDIKSSYPKLKPVADSTAAVEQEVREILSGLLKYDSELESDVEFNEYGLDSILSTTLLRNLEDRMKVKLSINEINEHHTISRLSLLVSSRLEEPMTLSGTKESVKPDYSGSEELVALNSSGSKETSFWVHGGPGYAAFFTKLSDELGNDYPLFAFQAKGVDGISIPRRFDDMVERYLSCLKAKQEKGPYIIGGYSSGGLIAYEMARRLTDRGDQIKALIMLDTLPVTDEALERIRTWHHANQDFQIMMMANELAGSKRNSKNIISTEDLSKMSNTTKIACVAELIKKRTTIPLSSDEIYNRIVGSIRLNEYVEEFYANYQGNKYQGSKVVYFKAEKGFLSESSWMGYDIEDVYKNYSYTDYWQDMIGSELEIIHVPSDHFNILDHQSLHMVADKIRTIVD